MVIGTTLLDGGTPVSALLLALGPHAEVGDTSSWVCEFGTSRYISSFAPPPEAGMAVLRPSLGDWRPGEVYSYDPAAKRLVNRTPRNEPLLNATLGMRSAGAVGDLVLLGGPNLAANFRGGPGSAIVLFAYHATTGAFLGAKAFPEFSNIRRWFTWTPPPGQPGTPQLFTAVRAMSGVRGRVLRWTGTVQAPFSYEEVGHLTEEGGYITGHAGRLFVSTWSDSSWTQTSGIWMSPPLDGPTGLTSAAQKTWSKVFSMSDYDPDEVVASTQYFGALASFGEYLYVGSMTVPAVGALAHAQRRGVFAAANAAGAARGIAVFRGSGFGTGAQRFELLYGERMLPAWRGFAWVPTPTLLGSPLYGRSGFGNPCACPRNEYRACSPAARLRLALFIPLPQGTLICGPPRCTAASCTWAPTTGASWRRRRACPAAPPRRAPTASAPTCGASTTPPRPPWQSAPTAAATAATTASAT